MQEIFPEYMGWFWLLFINIIFRNRKKGHSPWVYISKLIINSGTNYLNYRHFGGEMGLNKIFIVIINDNQMFML